MPYFYGPVAVILLSNLVIFLFTSRAFAKHYDKLKDLSRKKIFYHSFYLLVGSVDYNIIFVLLALDMAHSDFSTSDDWVRLSTVLGQQLSVQERSASPPREQQPIQMNFTHRLKKYKKM